MTPTDGSDTGRVLAGRYELHDELGRGAMGTVWLASDVVLGRDVAIKEVSYPAYTTSEERVQLRERTLREARAAARFQHPQATAVHDVIEEDGRPWIVMELVPSRTLSSRIREEGPLSPREAARVGVDILGVLQAAHLAGIVHRDVKPGNILLDEHGRAWLTDFGIATSVGDPGLTQAGILLGSPAYMAPERAQGAEPGPASDLWSLGATLYSAVEGRPPFDRGEPIATLLSASSDEPAPFRAAGFLKPVIQALLAKDPAVRPSDEQAMSLLQLLVRDADAEGARVNGATVATPDARGSARGEKVERLDRAVLLSLASTTGAATRAVARAAVHKAADKLEGAQAQAARSLADRAERPRWSSAREPASASPSPRPAAAAGAGRPQQNSAERGKRADRPRRRFKRRWIGIPLIVLLIMFLLMVVIAGVIVLAVVHSASASTGSLVVPLASVRLGLR